MKELRYFIGIFFVLAVFSARVAGSTPESGYSEIVILEPGAPVINYTTITTPTCITSNMTLSGVVITDETGIPLSGVLVPRIYYRKNAGAWFSRPGTNTGGNATNSTWNFTIVETDMAGVSAPDIVYYYIIAEDILSTPNVGSNPSGGLVATSVINVTTHPSAPNSYSFRYTLNGTYTVGTGGNFTTLTAAVNAYNNACAISGSTVFELTDNSYPSETFPITINNHIDASAVNTLTIRPSATAIPVITGNSALQTINLNGARYIRFDGRQGGAGAGKSMTVSTSSTGVTINFVNDAQNNVIRYCVVKGQRVGGFSGTIFFGTASASGTGNDNNSIENNDISEAGGFSNIGIYSGGTAGKENEYNTVINNHISNYFNPVANSYGIYISLNSSSWTISGNRFFQTATRLYTATSIHFGIYINTGASYTISNNVIGFANAAGTGTTNMIGNSVLLAGFPSSYSNSGSGQSIRYVGIGVALALAGPPTKIDGNIIGGIAMYTASNSTNAFGIFGGIYVESGTANIGATAGNIIGATTGSNSIYVATINGGSVIGIRSAAIGSAAIQNNVLGSITVSGTSAANTGRFTAISIGGACSYNVSDNSIGNADPDNIRIGYTQSGGLLSNTGSLTATNTGVSTIIKGIASGSLLSLTVTNNIFRGWINSCRSAAITGIETSGAMIDPSASIDVNKNLFGTVGTNWINAVADNTGTLYAINVSNTAATTYNIKDNDIRGAIFGTQNGVGGSFIRVTGASAANAITTISGNTFTNLNLLFSTGDLYFIYTSYSISSTGSLIIDGNRITGNFTGNGNAQYHMVHCAMTAAAASKASIINNDFSNLATATGFTSDLYGLYSSFSGSPCLLTVAGNTLNNWSTGDGTVVGIHITNMTGTASCGSNILSNIASGGNIEGINLSGSGSSGQFEMMNNTITGLISSGAGGYVYGISAYLSSIVNTTQTNIYRNIVSGLSSSASDIITGIFLDSGHPSATVSVADNKVYDISGSATGSLVYGIANYTALSGDIIYTNNYIGDLRAPFSSAAPSVAGMKLYMTGGLAKAYYNTIHLNASGTATQFSTAAIHADAATDVTLRNNIFSNVSAHGSSGKTVAYWRGDTNLGTYDAASNNNLFYAGTASAQNLVFYDGTNSDQALSAYQLRVGSRDDKSVSGQVNFTSTAGADVAFLHITATANCIVNSRGSNSGILLVTDYDVDFRSTTDPFVTDIGADEFSKKNVWTGANGTNWNDIGNWSEGVVPNATDENAVIANPPVNQPLIAPGDVFQVATLVIGAGASLTNRGTLKIAGSVYTVNITSFNNMQAGAVEGSVEMNGNCSMVQSLAGSVFVNNAVKNFTAGNDVTISPLPGEHINVSGELGFGAVSGKILNTGDNITLVSTVNGTANVGKITSGNIISGRASVERYINTGLSGHPKSWQFLATPAKGQTIFQSWQESGTTPAGYGTVITGTGSGFDIPTVQPSMKYFDPAAGINGNWVGINNTGNPIEDKRGYMIFVRGDRTVITSAAPPNPTTLRIKGTLYQPGDPPPVTSVLAGKSASAGNPYASAVSLDYMKDNGLFINLNNDVAVWDPLLNGTYNFGGYQTLAAANNYIPTAGGTVYYPSGMPSPSVQSGQAFFVRSSGLAGSVTFNEACKESSNRLVNRPPVHHSHRQYFRTTLYTNAGAIADGNAVVFDPIFSNRIDADDAYKITNSGENFGLRRDDKLLAVEARLPLQRADTIFYTMSNLRTQSYRLRFAPVNMQSTELKAFLVDRFLHTGTALSLADSSFVDISINDDPGSAAADRFYVVFKYKKAPVSPHSLTAKSRQENNLIEGFIGVYPNPVSGKNIVIHFINQPQGIYRVELLNSNGQRIYAGIVNVNNSRFVEQL